MDHARAELVRAGIDPLPAAVLAAVVALCETLRGVVAATVVAATVETLLEHRPLTPLTAHPDEWVDRSGVVGGRVWQSTRDPRAFSTDGGFSFTIDGDQLVGGEPVVRHSVAPPHWVALVEDQVGLTPARAALAVFAYLRAGELDDTDRVMLDTLTPERRGEYLRRRFGAGVALARILYTPPRTPPPRGVGG